jgi:ribosomal protein S27E
MDHLRIKCPNLTCRKILAVPSSSRGKNVRCKNCGATIRVPQKQAGPQTASQPLNGNPAKAA